MLWPRSAGDTEQTIDHIGGREDSRRIGAFSDQEPCVPIRAEPDPRIIITNGLADHGALVTP